MQEGSYTDLYNPLRVNCHLAIIMD